MRNGYMGVLSFARPKWVKVVVNAFVLVAMVLGLSMSPFVTDTAQAAALIPAETAKAAICQRMSVYTTRTGPENKPTVLVYWNKSGHPDAYKIKLYFDSKLIQTPSGGTVDTRYPQYNSGGWIGYFIATRWILGGNFLWDQDFRWKAYYC